MNAETGNFALSQLIQIPGDREPWKINITAALILGQIAVSRNIFLKNYLSMAAIFYFNILQEKRGLSKDAKIIEIF